MGRLEGVSLCGFTEIQISAGSICVSNRNITIGFVY